MSVPQKIAPAGLLPKSRRKSASPGGFGAGFTAAALVMALLLSASLPARAEMGGRDFGPRQHDRPWQQKTVLPKVCAIEFDAETKGRGHERPRKLALYSERCLSDKGLNARDFPRHCATNARLFGQRDRVYSEDCLASGGFHRAGQGG